MLLTSFVCSSLTVRRLLLRRRWSLRRRRPRRHRLHNPPRRLLRRLRRSRSGHLSFREQREIPPKNEIQNPSIPLRLARDELPLRELEAFARSGLSGLLALLHPRIAAKKTFRFERSAEISVHEQKR